MYRLLAVVLILVGVYLVTRVLYPLRERLEPTDKIKAPPYSDEEKQRIRNMIPQDKLLEFMGWVRNRYAKLVEVGRRYGDDGSNDNYYFRMGENDGDLSLYVSEFYTKVYQGSNVPITNSIVDGYFLSGAFLRASSSMSDSTPEIRKIIRDVLVAYFIDQAPPDPVVETAAPSDPVVETAAPPDTREVTPIPLPDNVEVMPPPKLDYAMPMPDSYVEMGVPTPAMEDAKSVPAPMNVRGSAVITINVN